MCAAVARGWLSSPHHIINPFLFTTMCAAIARDLPKWKLTPASLTERRRAHLCVFIYEFILYKAFLTTRICACIHMYILSPYIPENVYLKTCNQRTCTCISHIQQQRMSASSSSRRCVDIAPLTCRIIKIVYSQVYAWKLLFQCESFPRGCL